MSGAKKIKSTTFKLYGSSIHDFISIWEEKRSIVEYYDGKVSGVYDIAVVGSVAKVIFHDIINGSESDQQKSKNKDKSKNKTKEKKQQKSNQASTEMISILTGTTMKSGIETTFDVSNINIKTKTMYVGIGLSMQS